MAVWSDMPHPRFLALVGVASALAFFGSALLLPGLDRASLSTTELVARRGLQLAFLLSPLVCLVVAWRLAARSWAISLALAVSVLMIGYFLVYTQY